MVPTKRALMNSFYRYSIEIIPLSALDRLPEILDWSFDFWAGGSKTPNLGYEEAVGGRGWLTTSYIGSP